MTPHNDISALKHRLQHLAETFSSLSLSELMSAPDRDRLIVCLDDLSVDMTRQPLNAEILSELVSYADASGLGQKIEQLFSGQAVNVTENRAVSHMALRHPERQASEEWQALVRCADTIRTEGQFTDIINIGIGGSDLGPAMVAQALSADITDHKLHFVGNIDPSHLWDTLNQCDPHRTFVIVTSKTFTTAETLANASLVKRWLLSHDADPSRAMAGVTAASDKAEGWGMSPDLIFGFDQSVGGRFSLWSAVGLSVMIGLGADKFSQFLSGAHDMDEHFRQAPFSENLPVLMGLIRIWHRNFLNRPSYALIPYHQRLSRLAAWAQQLEMESNGKSVTCDGQPVTASTAPLIWGEPGTNAQHSFFQWLHQGSEIHPLDILVTRRPYGVPDDEGWQNSHRQLVINAIAQAEALALGRADKAYPHKDFTGNRPSVLLSWDQLTPYALGRVLALYEHITAVCGFIWNINSFDQFGVELGKEMARDLDEGKGLEKFSPSALALLDSL